MTVEMAGPLTEECDCGHTRGYHKDTIGPCSAGTPYARCGCREFYVPYNDDEEPAPSERDRLWEWAESVGRAVHPVYVANDWRWWVKDAPDGVKEVPSPERIAATVYRLARGIQMGELLASEEVHTGRLEVFRFADEESGELAFGCNLQLDTTADLPTESGS